MEVAIAGGHGGVARHLARILAGRGDTVRAIIRNPDHVDDVRDDGARPVLCDLEAADDPTVDRAGQGADAIVFAAGAGPGSGPERKWTVDYGAARKLMDAARRTGVARYVMLSSMGADDPPQDDAVFSVYLRAKAKADADLTVAGLDHTIVRPGRLTDEPGTGRVRVAEHVERGDIPRPDVAAVLAATLADARTIGRTFEVVSGDDPVPDALAGCRPAS